MKEMGMEFLLNEIETDIENCEYRLIAEYQKVVDGLKAIFSDEYIKDIINALDELKENEENWNTYEAIKAETLANTGDENLAEDVAWELVYS